MTDRFDEMAGRVQMDLAAFAMPTGTSARRVIADALRAAHAGGVDEAAATIDQLRADVKRLTAERNAAFEQGRLVGRADVAKYARAIGEIESVVGIVGAVPMPQTVQAVRDLVSRAEKAERELDRLRSDAKTLAAEHFAADYRAAIARADKAEDERDEDRAENDLLRAGRLRAETVIAARECLSVAWRDSVWGTKRIAELSDAIADDMTEHAYQELASALESPPRIAGKTAGFDQPGREYTAGDALGLRRDR